MSIGTAKAKRRVLLVDDERAILRILSIKLRISGYDVLTASGGEEALAMFDSAAPDIILLDVAMPGIDGFEVLRRLRIFSGLPIIVLSALREHAQEVLSLGANDFLAKPFDFDNLTKRIEKSLTHKY